MKQINWGIIGLGNIAIEIAKVFKLINNAKLLSIASRDKNKIEKFATDFQIDKKFCFNSYDSLIDCQEIEVVYIALPNSLHYELIKKCLKANKKILVEKPATLNFLEIEKIKKNFDMKNFFFAEGFMYRHHPQILKIIELINKKKIGNLIQMKSNFGKDILSKKNFFGIKKRKKPTKKNRLFNKELGGGAILDLGCYPVSLSILIASLNKNINLDKLELINIKKNFSNAEVDLDSYAELNFENKFKSFIGASFTKNLGKETQIIGDSGSLIIKDSWHGNPSIIKIINNEEKEIIIKNQYNVYYYQINNISKNILEGRSKPEYPAMNFEDSFLNMKIIDKWLVDEK